MFTRHDMEAFKILRQKYEVKQSNGHYKVISSKRVISTELKSYKTYVFRLVQHQKNILGELKIQNEVNELFISAASP